MELYNSLVSPGSLFDSNPHDGYDPLKEHKQDNSAADIVNDAQWNNCFFDKLDKLRHDSIGNYGGLYGMDANFMANELYEKCGFINSSVNKFFETALNIVFSLYQTYIKLKETNGDELTKMGDELCGSFYHYENIRKMLITQKDENKNTDCESDECSDFAKFVYKIFKNYKCSDPFLVADYYHYIDEVAKLRGEFDSYANRGFIKFDVENSPEFSNKDKSNTYMWNSGLVFKLRPIIIECGKLTEYADKPDNILCGWKVLLDIRSLAISLLSKSCLDNLSPEEAASITKDIFVSRELGRYTDLIDQYSKLISISILNQSAYIRNNISAFCSKVNRVYDKCLDDRNNRVLLRIIQSEFGSSAVGDKDYEYAMKNASHNPFTPTNDYCGAKHITANMIDNSICDIMDDSDSSSLINNIERDTFRIIDPYWCEDKSAKEINMCLIKTIASNVLKEAFIHYFEDTIFAAFVETKLGFKLIEYTREFDAKFDMDHIQTVVSGSDKYSVKLYFRDMLPLISSLNYVSSFNYSVKNTKAAKDNPAFLYSKYKRLVWIYLFGEINYLGDTAAMVDFSEDSCYKAKMGKSKMRIQRYISCMMSAIKAISAPNGSFNNSCEVYFGVDYGDYIGKIKYILSFMNKFIHSDNNHVYNGCETEDPSFNKMIISNYIKETGFTDKSVPNCMNDCTNIPLSFDGIYLSDNHDIWTSEGIRVNFTVPSIDVIFDSITKKLRDRNLM